MADQGPLKRDALVMKVHELVYGPQSQEQVEDQQDGSMVMIKGYPAEVVVRITDSKISVAVFSLRWEGPHTSVICPEQIGSLNWR